jgi:CzcA family heavy metal efflux pump
MSIIGASIRNRSTVFLSLFFIVLMGVTAYRDMPREAAPDITIPYIIVSTPYFGVSPSDIETLVTIPIENKLKNIGHVKEIRSTSAEGVSIISIEFEADFSIDDAMQKVRDKVGQAQSELPTDAEDPIIQEINISDFPIMTVNISGETGLVRLKEIAESLQDRIEGVPGVLNVDVTGGREREIRIEYLPDRLSAYHLTHEDIVRAVQGANVNIPAGNMILGEADFLIRVPGEFASPREIGDLVVAVSDRRPVYVRDVAQVVDGYKEVKTYSRLDGTESVTVSIQKRSGENVVAICDQVREIVRAYERSKPESVTVTISMDASKDIRKMVSELNNEIISGVVLVILVIFLFLGVVNSLFVAAAIPFSMLISFAVLHLFGITLNMVVMFSMILVVGMLVDDAVVIVENCYRHLQMGKNRRRASLDGASEVIIPVLTSTLTTVVAFVPFLFWPGIFGEFMWYLPVTVITALMASFFIALVANPTLTASFMRLRHGSSIDHIDEETGITKNPKSLINEYEKLLRWALRHRYLTIGGSFALLVLILGLYGVFGKGVQFFPDTEATRAQITMKTAEGSALAVTDRIARQVEEIVAAAPDIVHYTTDVGTGGGGIFSGGMSTKANNARVSVEFAEKADRSQSTDLTIEQMRGKLSAIVGAEIDIKKEQHGPPTAKPINIEISGNYFATLGELAATVREEIKDVPGIVDLKDDYDRGRPEIRVLVDKRRASLLGFSASGAAMAVRAAVNGAEAGKFREADDEYDISVRLPLEYRDDVSTLQTMMIASPAGRDLVPLSAIADITFSSGLGSIRRVGGKRVITVESNVSGRLANDVLGDVRARLAAFPLPEGYAIAYTGENKEQDESRAFLMNAFLTALVLIFLVIVPQYNSIIIPLIIMSSVILSLVGVFLGLMVTRTPFGIMMTGIGVISLAGVVVKNAILLLTAAQMYRERGFDLLEAVVIAGKTRVRPVFLTASSTIMGLVPMATGVSFDFLTLRLETGVESAQFWGPMAKAVIFGLAFATALTLLFVPAVYLAIEGIKARLFGNRPVKGEDDDL